MKILPTARDPLDQIDSGSDYPAVVMAHKNKMA